MVAIVILSEQNISEAVDKKKTAQASMVLCPVQ